MSKNQINFNLIANEMKNLEIAIIGILILFPCGMYSQTLSSSPNTKESKDQFDWRLSVSGGLAHHYDDRLGWGQGLR